MRKTRTTPQGNMKKTLVLWEYTVYEIVGRTTLKWEIENR